MRFPLLAAALLPLCSASCGVNTIASGKDFSCVVMGDGGVKCWGYNGYGQLGLGDTTHRGSAGGQMGTNLPSVDLGPGRTGVQVSCGQRFSCALLDDGNVKCWGANDKGQLGQGDLTPRGSSGGASGQMGSNLPPAKLGVALGSIAQIVSGYFHTCLRTSSGAVKCWGNNNYGQLGNGPTAVYGDSPSTVGANLPTVSLPKTAAYLCAGWEHTCAVLSDGTLVCWGRNSYGQLGYQDTQTRGTTTASMGGGLLPVALGAGRTAVTCSGGEAFTCAVLDDSSVKCWGNADRGQLGYGDITRRGDQSNTMGSKLPAVDLGTATNQVGGVSCGDARVCVHTNPSGKAKCWGDENFGALGYGDTLERGGYTNTMGTNLPDIDLGTGYQVKEISSGEGFNCAILADNRVKCWGLASSGQLGSGSMSQRGSLTSHMGDNLAVVDLGQCSPTAAPLSAPSAAPSPLPSSAPSAAPSAPPSVAPTGSPQEPPTVPPSISPTSTPSTAPSTPPSPTPTASPLRPTTSPSPSPSAAPQKGPSAAPSAAPSPSPTAAPQMGPTLPPSAGPTAAPSAAPSASPQAAPSVPPTPSPSMQPTAGPSAAPQAGPTAAPSQAPSAPPTSTPTLRPSPPAATQPPTAPPVLPPTAPPSPAPSRAPSASPTLSPTARPTAAPTAGPTAAPVVAPSPAPSAAPSAGPVGPTASPTAAPLGPTAAPLPPSAAPASPTAAPAQPTAAPADPTLGPKNPTAAPQAGPSAAPSLGPSATPTSSPTDGPSRPPSAAPSLPPSPAPSAAPSPAPSAQPTPAPSAVPSSGPSAAPTSTPSVSPSGTPSSSPSRSPSASPSLPPSQRPSKAPSQGPSDSPTTPPSPTPTYSPTAAPSQAPSVPPTFAPSSQPTVTPTQAPSTPPSVRPSALPTASPSAGPSGTPSRTPSLLPSPTPSAHPTQAPSAPPSAPPIGPPSGAPSVSLPSGAPSMTPSGDPSSSPAADPTTSPSAHPASTAPSALPSRAPTVKPPVSRATAVAGGTADATSSVALVVGAPAAAQAGRLTAVTEGCKPTGAGHEEDPELAMIFHPTGVKIQGSSSPALAGCIIMNTAIIAGAALLAFAASAALQRAKGLKWWEAQGMLRVPTGPVMVAVVLLQGPVYSAAYLIRRASGAGDVWLAILGLSTGFCLPLVLLRAGRQSQEQAVYKLDPKAAKGFARIWLGPGEWLSIRNARVERWGAAFRAVLPGEYPLLATDIALANLALLSGGLGGGSCAACGIVRLVDVLIAVGLSVYMFKKRPFARPLRLPLTLAAQGCLAAGSLALAIGYFSGDCPSTPPANSGVAGVFLAAAGFLVLGTAVVDATCVLRGIQLGRRTQLAATLAQFQKLAELNPKNSGEIDKEDLREYMAEHHNVPDEEFEREFAKMDTDRSGALSLHEFITNEGVFWRLARPEGQQNRSVRGPKGDGGEMEGATPLLPLGDSYSGGRGHPSRLRNARRVDSIASAGGDSVRSRGSRSPRVRRAIVVSGAGLPALNGEYALTHRQRSSMHMRPYRNRNGALLTHDAGGGWRIEAPPHMGLSPRRSLPTDLPAGIGDNVAYWHSGLPALGDTAPSDGWELGPLGVAPAPSVTQGPEELPQPSWAGGTVAGLEQQGSFGPMASSSRRLLRSMPSQPRRARPGGASTPRGFAPRESFQALSEMAELEAAESSWAPRGSPHERRHSPTLSPRGSRPTRARPGLSLTTSGSM